MSADESSESSFAVLRIAFVPGVTIRKWTTRWEERHPNLPLQVIPVPEAEGVAALRSDLANVSFVRLPIERDGLSVIRLYGEVSVLAVPRDSELSTRESISADEVAGLGGLVSYSDVASAKDALALVAAGVGALQLPHSIARLNARKDVVAVPIDGATETEIAICWIADETTEAIDEFVGIVRGRTAASSRSVPTPPKERPKRVSAPASAKQRRPQPRRRQGR